MITVTAPSRYRVSRKTVRTSVEALYKKYRLNPQWGINIIFVGTRKMRDIARTYKKEDVALPVLSFPYKSDSPDGEPLFGEIILCYPQVVLLAAEREKRIDAMIESLLEHGMNNLLKKSIS